MHYYRGMKADANGKPVVGDNARSLGIRDGDVRINGGLIGPGDGGMSVTANDPMGLPGHRRPKSLGGNGKDPVFEISSGAVPNSVRVRQDNPVKSPTHYLFESAAHRPVEEFRAILAATRDDWRIVHD